MTDTSIYIYIWGHFVWSISQVTDKTKLLIRTRTQFEVTDLRTNPHDVFGGDASVSVLM